MRSAQPTATPMPPVTYVATPDDLAVCVKALKSARLIALDTEFVGEHTYYPALALVQLAARGHIWLVDPVALPDLTPLAAPLSNPKITVIMHDAEIDLQVMARASGATLPHPFDTQLAAAFVGLTENTGLASLVATLLGQHLAKGQQVSDWLKRPLSDKQLQYAAVDVLYLEAIYKLLHRRLARLDRMGPLEEEMATRRERWLAPPDLACKFRGMLEGQNLSVRQHAAVAALLSWRETTAQTRNIPRRHVLHDDTLMLIALGLPASYDELKGFRQVPEKAVKRYGEEILRLCREALALPDERRPLPRQRRLDGEGVAARMPFVKMAAEALANEAHIASGLIARAKELEELCRYSRHQATPPDLPALMGWRGELVGKRLWRFARGECALRLGVDPKGPAIVLEDRHPELNPASSVPADLAPLRKPHRRRGPRRPATS